MKFIDFFSGIGGFHSGLELAGMECVGWCEFDKFAQKSYRAMYDTEDLYFNNDVKIIKGKNLPKADLWAFGFPCQDISIAGKQEGIKQVGNLLNTTSFGGNPQRGRVYSADGVAPTLTCSGGGNMQPKIIEKPKNKIQNFGNVSAYTNDNTVWETGIARTLTASDYKHPQKVASKKKNKIKIRKLTPLECFRLQGFTDKQFKAAQAVNSTTQLYKQAGNAVTVNVVKEIGTHIVQANSELNKRTSN